MRAVDEVHWAATHSYQLAAVSRSCGTPPLSLSLSLSLEPQPGPAQPTSFYY